MVIEVDQPIEEEVLQQIALLPHITQVTKISD